MFCLNDSFKQQISAVLVADDIVSTLKFMKKDTLKDYESQIGVNQKYIDKIDLFQKEKEQMGFKLKELTQDNESLKHKFSQLLDQFQEYVNESERKSEEDQMNHKSEQEKLLCDLNQTIKELDELSNGLQQDVQDKEKEINELLKEKDGLLDQLKENEEDRNAVKSHDDVNKVQIKSLNEEIKYIKQQYMMEVEQLRGENVTLHKQIQERSSSA